MSDQFQHKLFNYHAQPPSEVWDKITVALDQEPGFPERIKNYQITPPPFIWDNIAASLDENQAIIQPFSKRFKKPFRYGAVAASLLFAALLINLLFTKRSISDEGVAPPKKSESTSVLQPEKKIIKAQHDIETQEGQQTANSFINTNRKRDVGISITPLRSNNKKNNPRIDQVVMYNNPIVNSELVDRYSIFSKNNGEAFRVSKKLFNLFLCSEVNEFCKLNIEMVQDRVASPSVIASADFSGVLDLLQSMNNQQR